MEHVFSTKKRQESRHSPASPRIAAEDGVGPGGFRRGKAGRSDSKKGCCQELGFGRTWKVRRRPGDSDPTRRPRLGGGLRKAAPLYRRASLLGPQATLREVLGGFLGSLGFFLGAPLGGS